MLNSLAATASVCAAGLCHSMPAGPPNNSSIRFPQEAVPLPTPVFPHSSFQGDSSQLAFYLACCR